MSELHYTQPLRRRALPQYYREHLNTTGQKEPETLTHGTELSRNSLQPQYQRLNLSFQPQLVVAVIPKQRTTQYPHPILCTISTFLPPQSHLLTAISTFTRQQSSSSYTHNANEQKKILCMFKSNNNFQKVKKPRPNANLHTLGYRNHSQSLRPGSGLSPRLQVSKSTRRGDPGHRVAQHPPRTGAPQSSAR